VTRKSYIICILVVCVSALTACVSLRFSQVDPAARDFHPQSIAILNADVGPYEEAKGVVEKVVADVLREKRWFPLVVDNQSLNNQIQANEELRNAMNEYLSKLKALNFSDPYLSRKIGEIIKADAFLIVSVDIWKYMVEDDKKIAKVSMGMKLYETVTGQVMWKAGHHRAESYMLIKPELSKVAGKVADDMFGYMPR